MKYSYSKDIESNFLDTENKVKDALLGVGFGVLMPCNVLVIDNENQTTKVVFPRADSLLDVTDNKDIFLLAKKVDKLLESAFNKIK